MSDTTRQVDELIEGLRGDAPEAEGHWTLERERARELAEKHLLERPREYILLLVRAAIRRGAPDIRVRVEHDLVVMRFAGEPFRREELDRLHDAVIAPRGAAASPGLRELALAIIAVRTLGFKMVQLASGGDKNGVCLSWKGTAQPDLVSGHRTTAATHIELQGTGIGEAQERGCRVEQRLLQRHCRYTPTPMLLNGSPLSDPRAFAGETAATLAHTEEGLRIEAGFTAQQDNPAEVRFMSDGVWVATEPLEGEAQGYVAYAHADGLRLDLSQSKVTQDEVYEGAMAATKQLLSEAQSRNHLERECTAILDQSTRVQKRLNDIVQRYSGSRTGLGFGGILLALVAVSLTVGVALWQSGLAAFFVGLAGLLFVMYALNRLWEGSDKRFRIELLTAFRPKTGNQHLMYTAYLEHENQEPYLLFRPLLDEFLKHNAEAELKEPK